MARLAKAVRSGSAIPTSQSGIGIWRQRTGSRLPSAAIARLSAPWSVLPLGPDKLFGTELAKDFQHVLVVGERQAGKNGVRRREDVASTGRGMFEAVAGRARNEIGRAHV